MSMVFPATLADTHSKYLWLGENTHRIKMENVASSKTHIYYTCPRHLTHAFYEKNHFECGQIASRVQRMRLSHMVVTSRDDARQTRMTMMEGSEYEKKNQNSTYEWIISVCGFPQR